jgi:4-amino-4-deoxy-L-arabinose transferase-like glycosyltransferase
MATKATNNSQVEEHKDSVGARRDLPGLAILAVMSRLAWIFWGAWSGGDVAEYVTLAKNLAFNHVFSLSPEGAASIVPTSHRPPLYPALIATLWWGDSVPATAVMILQAILGAGTIILVYLIARDRFSRTVALIAGICMALGPMSGHYVAGLMTETLFTFLLTFGFFLWGRKRFAWTGFFFGLAMLTRMTLTPFLLLLLLLPLLPAWRRHWRAHVLIFLVAMAVPSVWVIRNAIVFSRFIPVASSGYGTNLLFGTIETKLFDDDVWTAVLSDPVTKVELRDGAGEGEADRVLLQRAIQRIKADPLRWLRVRVKQYPRLFMDSGDYLLGSSNVAINQAWRERRWPVILTKAAFMLGNLLFFGLAALGIIVERKRFVSLAHLTLFPVFLTLVHLPLWIEARYAVPMIPLAAILAAAGLVRLIEFLRGYKRKTAQEG